MREKVRDSLSNAGEILHQSMFITVLSANALDSHWENTCQHDQRNSCLTEMKHGLKIYDAKRIAVKADGTKLPVVDSKFTFLLTPNEQDIKNGIPGDHANCMYCLACRRMHGSEMVWVTRNLAYVELRGKNGRHELHRFILGDPARSMVKDFDEEIDVPPLSVMFMAPKGSKKLNVIAANWRKWQAKIKAGHTPKKKAHIVGQKKDHSIRPLERTLRDPATGMFQFKQKPNA